MIVQRNQAVIHKPIESSRCMGNSQPHECGVGGVAADPHDIVKMQLWRVSNALLLLQTRSSRTHLAGGEE